MNRYSKFFEVLTTSFNNPHLLWYFDIRRYAIQLKRQSNPLTDFNIFLNNTTVSFCFSTRINYNVRILHIHSSKNEAKTIIYTCLLISYLFTKQTRVEPIYFSLQVVNTNLRFVHISIDVSRKGRIDKHTVFELRINDFPKKIHPSKNKSY